jgi:hypothetical protein
MAFTLAIGAKAPNFELIGADGAVHTFLGEKSVQGAVGTVLFFTCNHCPFVQNSEERMKRIYDKCEPLQITMVAVHSNETVKHPEDDFELVKQRATERGFKWLSLWDRDQLVAKSIGAQRTPHFFLFDCQGALVYSGRLDNSPRDPSKAETHELADAIDDLASGRPVRVAETTPIGCNVKWWDKDMHWMPGDVCDLDYLYTRR